MTILMNDALGVNVDILKRTNELFGIAQKRVSTGKRIFTSADDTTRYKSSETLLDRSRQLSDVNNNISLGLATLEATNETLNQMRGLVEAAIDLASAAQREGSSGARSAETTALIGPTDVVTGVTIGSKLSITSDGGKNFTYTFNSLSVTWGEIANALNAANIGVMADFIPGPSPSSTVLRFRSINDKDFNFDAVSDQNVMDDLAGLASPSGQVFNPINLFANGLAVPGAGETGFAVTYGGRLTGTGAGVTGATAIAAGSSIVIEDGTGGYRTLNYGAATTVNQVISDVLALGIPVRADLVNQTGGAGGPLQFRLRNLNGGDMRIVAANGDFAGGGVLGLSGPSTGFAATLSSNNALRLAYGQQYDAIIENLDELVANNPVPRGRNLLTGENLSVMLSEFTGKPLKLTGIAVTAAGTLTMAQAGATWVNDLNIQTSATQARAAQKFLLELQTQFATFNNYVKERYDLNKSYQGDTKVQGDDLVAADATEESASLIALQTRQQFAVQALSIGNQNQQSLLRLLGS